MGHALKGSSTVGHVLCTLTCTLSKEVQLIPGRRDGLGIYTGIFAMYLQYPPNKTRTTIIFYALCLLYVLTTATIVADLVVVTFQVSDNSVCKNIIFNQLCSCDSAKYRLSLKITYWQF